MPNLYQNPAYDPKNRMNPSQLQNHFDAFYEDIWCELCKYGELEELVVCDNNNDRKFPSPLFWEPAPHSPKPPRTRFARRKHPPISAINLERSEHRGVWGAGPP